MRLFIAFDLPEEVRGALRELMSRLKPAAGSVRWVRPEGMHVTLKFIGETDANKLDSIRAALAAIHSPAPAEMRFRGLGFFPDERRPRVIWCGIEASRNVAALAADIESALEPLGIPRETRDFTPHLTLARIASPGQGRGLVSAAAGVESPEFGATREIEFHLFESILGRSGAQYKRLATYPFVRAAT